MYNSNAGGKQILGSTQPCTPTRMTIGQQAVEKLRSLMNRADTMSARVESVLSSVIRNEPTSAGADCMKLEEWPPLFAEMRGIMGSIDCAFNRIEDVLNRVEL